MEANAKRVDSEGEQSFKVLKPISAEEFTTMEGEIKKHGEYLSSNMKSFRDGIERTKTFVSKLKRTRPYGWKSSVKILEQEIKDGEKLYSDSIAEWREREEAIRGTRIMIDYLELNIEKYPFKYCLVQVMGEGVDDEIVIKLYPATSPGFHEIFLVYGEYVIEEERTECLWLSAVFAFRTNDKNGRYLYKREEFGLPGRRPDAKCSGLSDPADLEDPQKDEFFYIRDTAELGIILQKFDSWIGSGLD